MQEKWKELISAKNELIKCIIYDTFIIKVVNKLGLEVKEQYRRG